MRDILFSLIEVSVEDLTFISEVDKARYYVCDVEKDVEYVTFQESIKDGSLVYQGDIGTHPLKKGVNSFKIQVIKGNECIHIFHINIVQNQQREEEIIQKITIDGEICPFSEQLNCYWAQVPISKENVMIDVVTSNAKDMVAGDIGEIYLDEGENPLLISVNFEQSGRRKLIEMMILRSNDNMERGFGEEDNLLRTERSTLRIEEEQDILHEEIVQPQPVNQFMQEDEEDEDFSFTNVDITSDLQELTARFNNIKETPPADKMTAVEKSEESHFQAQTAQFATPEDEMRKLEEIRRQEEVKRQEEEIKRQQEELRKLEELRKQEDARREEALRQQEEEIKRQQEEIKRQQEEIRQQELARQQQATQQPVTQQQATPNEFTPNQQATPTQQAETNEQVGAKSSATLGGGQPLLKNLVVDGAVLKPAFESGIYDYTMILDGFTVEELEIHPEVLDNSTEVIYKQGKIPIKKVNKPLEILVRTDSGERKYTLKLTLTKAKKKEKKKKDLFNPKSEMTLKVQDAMKQGKKDINNSTISYKLLLSCAVAVFSATTIYMEYLEPSMLLEEQKLNERDQIEAQADVVAEKVANEEQFLEEIDRFKEVTQIIKERYPEVPAQQEILGYIQAVNNTGVDITSVQIGVPTIIDASYMQQKIAEKGLQSLIDVSQFIANPDATDTTQTPVNTRLFRVTTEKISLRGSKEQVLNAYSLLFDNNRSMYIDNIVWSDNVPVESQGMLILETTVTFTVEYYQYIGG